MPYGVKQHTLTNNFIENIKNNVMCKYLNILLPQLKLQAEMKPIAEHNIGAGVKEKSSNM